jgi:hypothetical protein
MSMSSVGMVLLRTCWRRAMTPARYGYGTSAPLRLTVTSASLILTGALQRRQPRSGVWMDEEEWNVLPVAGCARIA